MLQFSAYGHPNIHATHRTTLEFTKAAKLSKEGDCIVGVKATFDHKRIREFLQHTFNFVLHIIVDDESVSLNAHYNPKFDDEHELVLRKGEFASSRTLGMFASISANDIPRSMITKLKNPKQEVIIRLEKTAE